MMIKYLSYSVPSPGGGGSPAVPAGSLGGQSFLSSTVPTSQGCTGFGEETLMGSLVVHTLTLHLELLPLETQLSLVYAVSIFLSGWLWSSLWLPLETKPPKAAINLFGHA